MKQLGLIAWILAIFLLPSIAWSQSTDYEALVRRGIQFYSEKKYDEAIEYFKRAEKLNDSADVSYNIARSYHQLDNCQLALTYYAKFQSQTKSAEERKSAQKHIDALSACNMDGALLVLCSPANTTFRIDKTGEPLRCGSVYNIAAGNRTLVFEAPGLSSVTRVINVVADKQQKLTVSLDNNEPANAVLNAHLPKGEGDAEDAYSNMQDVEEVVDVAHYDNGINWLGLGFIIGGGVTSFIGGTLLGAAHREIDSDKKIELYDRRDDLFVSGWIFTTVGLISTTAGIVMTILDLRITSPKKNLTFKPVIETGIDSASAGFVMTF